MLSHLIDRLYNVVTTWPQLTGWEALSLVLNLIAMIPLAVAVVRAKKEGESLLEVACEKRLGRDIRSELGSGLLTETAIRTLADTAQNETGAPNITDKMILEVLRTLWAKEWRGRHPQRDQRLLELSDLAASFHPKGERLMSIAVTNRMLAYVLSIIACSAAAFSANLWSTRATTDLWRMLGLLVGIGAQVWLIVLAVRVRRRWRSRSDQLRSRSSKAPRVSAPSTSRFLADPFSHIAHSPSSGVHLHLASLWETFLFFALSQSILPIVIGLVMVQGSRYLGIEPLNLRDAVRRALTIYVVVALLATPALFAWLHGYRAVEALRLRAKLPLLERDRRLVELGVKPLDPDLDNDYRDVRQRLWVITGEDRYGPPWT